MGLRLYRTRSIFEPNYNELSLSMMSLAFLLVFFSNESLRNGLFKLLSQPKDRSVISMFLLPFAAGLVLPLYHVFSQREKTIVEKHIMLFFAVLTNGISGIYASAYIISKSADVHFIFILLPIWNIINCVILLISYRVGLINVSNISDVDVRPIEVLFGFIITLAIFALCQFVFKLYWALTFSICVIYATSFGDALSSMFHPETEQAMPESFASFAIDRKVKKALKDKGQEQCGFCGREIPNTETPWVVGKKSIVCKSCYDKIQREKAVNP